MLLLRQSVHPEHDVFGAGGHDCSQFDAGLYAVNEGDHIGWVIPTDNFDRAAGHLWEIALERFGSHVLAHALADHVVIAAHARDMGSEPPLPNLTRALDIEVSVAPTNICAPIGSRI